MSRINTKKFVDGYGEQLWSYLKTGEPKSEIIERDDGFISLGNLCPKASSKKFCKIPVGKQNI